MPATIYDVAARSGVSTATVSRILSGKITSRSKSYQKVMTAVDELGYTSPMLCAAKLPAQPHTQKVMLIVDDLTNPFYQGIICGITAVLAEKNYFAAGGTLWRRCILRGIIASNRRIRAICWCNHVDRN